MLFGLVVDVTGFQWAWLGASAAFLLAAVTVLAARAGFRRDLRQNLRRRRSATAVATAGRVAPSAATRAVPGPDPDRRRDRIPSRLVDAFLDPDPEFIAVGSVDHLVYVAGVAVLGVLLLTNRGWVRAGASAIRRVTIVVVVLQQSALYGFYAYTSWDTSESLPLHVSRISALLALLYLMTGSRRVMDVLFYFGLWAWTSFSYPQNIQPMTNILGWSFFVNHVVVLLMPAFAWITTDWRPTVRALWRSFGWFLLYVAAAVAANALTGGNYFYQRDKPVLPGLPQPYYLLVSVLGSLALFWLGYAVARLVARRTDHGAAGGTSPDPTYPGPGVAL